MKWKRNIKVLLIGGKTAADAELYILCLAPYFVERKLYKTGCHCTTYEYERMYPTPKHSICCQVIWPIVPPSRRAHTTHCL